MAYTSKFPGKCSVCGARYPVGTPIIPQGSSWAHARCPVPQDQDTAVIVKDRPLPTTYTNGDGVTRVELNSVAEVMDIAFNTELGNHPHGRSIANDILSSAGGSFTNGYTADTLQAAMLTAPQSLVSALEDMKRQIEDRVAPPQHLRRHRRNHLEDGEELDPVAWIQRKSDGWSDSVREPSRKPVVRIAVNVASLSREHSGNLLYRGAAAAALADIYTTLGHSVEVVVFRSSREVSEDIKHIVMSVKVKAADAPLDIATVAVATSEIAFCRLVLFSASTRLAKVNPNASVGISTTLPDRDKAGFDVVIDREVMDRESAVNAAMESLAKIAGAQQ